MKLGSRCPTWGVARACRTRGWALEGPGPSRRRAGIFSCVVLILWVLLTVGWVIMGGGYKKTELINNVNYYQFGFLIF